MRVGREERMDWPGWAERELVAHCAPTLAGLKSGSLFCLRCRAREAERLARLWDERLAPAGVHVYLLFCNEADALVYVYREKLLAAEWARPGAAEFLARYGYDPAQPWPAQLRRLRGRLAMGRAGGAVFPHEIGLFLGYPLADVRGFIENQGRGFCCAGCWKAYGDRPRAEKNFARLRKCRAVYLKCHARGSTLQQLTVCK